MSDAPERVPATADELQRVLQRTRAEAEEKLRDKDLRIAELESARREEAQRGASVRAELEERLQEQRRHGEQYSALLCTEKQERREERKQYQEALLREKEERREEKSKLEEKLEKMEGKYDEKENKLRDDLRTAQEQHREEKSRLEAQHREEKSQLEAQHREEKSRLEAQLAAALGRNERMMQSFQEGVERESRERDDMRDAAERNQRDLAKEWRDRLEAEQERWAAERARLSGRIQELEARPDALAPAVQQIAALVRYQVAYGTVDRGLELVAQEEARARAQLTTEEGAARRALEQQRDESLKQVHSREAARAEAVFTARGLSMSALRRKYLGKGPATYRDSYAAGEGLYKLFLALRPGGPVDGFAMRVLLRGETGVTHLWYNTQGQGYTWTGTHFTIPAADAYELAACVLCHLPALQDLGFRYLPPLSTRSLEWVSHLPRRMKELSFGFTAYTVADLREMHRRRGDRTFRVYVHPDKCTNWGEFEGVDDDSTKRTRVNEELGGMVYWYS